MMMSALLLTALAGAGMLLDLERRSARDMEARAGAAGALFAQWFRAAHHLAQSEEAHYRNLVALHGGVSVPGARLRRAGLVPAWMPGRTDAGQALTLGVIDDGRGVPMAFALASPEGPLSALYLESFVAGAAANRVGDVAGPGREAQATRWQRAIEQVLGRPLEPGELYATADAGVPYDHRIVYRRAQPGRAGQARMETTLAFAGDAGISAVGELDAQRAGLAEGLRVGTLRAGGGLATRSASVEDEVRALHLGGQSVAVDGVLSASRWDSGPLGAGSVTVETELSAHAAAATGAVAAPGTLAIARRLEATSVRGATMMSERLEAWGSPGRVEASGGVEAYYSAGERAAFRGRVTVTRWCAGC